VFKSLFFLLALGPASAAIMATVDCSASPTSFSGNFVECGDNAVRAEASPYQAFVDANAYPGFNSAYATVSGIYEFTVTGGTGGGFFAPCIVAQAARGSASALFGPFGVNAAGAGGGGYCPLTVAGTIPFTYDVPQVFQFDLEASTSSGAFFGGTAEADLGGLLFAGVGAQSGFVFYDANGNRLSNVDFNFNPAELTTPEPATFACSALLLSILIQAKRKRANQRLV